MDKWLDEHIEKELTEYVVIEVGWLNGQWTNFIYKEDYNG